MCFGFCYTEGSQELSLKKGIQCLSQLWEKVKLDFPVSVRTAARSDFTVFDFVGCFTNRATENSWVSSENVLQTARISYVELNASYVERK